MFSSSRGPSLWTNSTQAKMIYNGLDELFSDEVNPKEDTCEKWSCPSHPSKQDRHEFMFQSHFCATPYHLPWEQDQTYETQGFNTDPTLHKNFFGSFQENFQEIFSSSHLTHNKKTQVISLTFPERDKINFRPSFWTSLLHAFPARLTTMANRHPLLLPNATDHECFLHHNACSPMHPEALARLLNCCLFLYFLELTHEMHFAEWRYLFESCEKILLSWFEKLSHEVLFHWQSSMHAVFLPDFKCGENGLRVNTPFPIFCAEVWAFVFTTTSKKTGQNRTGIGHRFSFLDLLSSNIYDGGRGWWRQDSFGAIYV